jgi:hypothetical protein
MTVTASVAIPFRVVPHRIRLSYHVAVPLRTEPAPRKRAHVSPTRKPGNLEQGRQLFVTTMRYAVGPAEITRTSPENDGITHTPSKGLLAAEAPSMGAASTTHTVNTMRSENLHMAHRVDGDPIVSTIPKTRPTLYRSCLDGPSLPSPGRGVTRRLDRRLLRPW